MADATRNPYHDHLKDHLLPYIRDHVDARSRIAALTDTVLALALLDLECVRDLLACCYDHHHGGRKQRDPIALLRTFIVMALLGEHRINHFIHHLRVHPELRLLCGFELTDEHGHPDAGPGVATLYDFIVRVLDGPPPPPEHIPSWERPSIRRRGRVFLRCIKQEKLDRQAARTHLKRAREVLAEIERETASRGHTQRLAKFSGRLQRLLAIAAVAPSARLGILPHLLDIAADGTVLPTHASSFGKEPALPAEEGHREYSDPEATWGYDATRKEHYFGHKAHAWVARAGKRDLPLWVHVDGAHEPDVILAERDLPDLVYLLGCYAPGHTVRAVIADAAYDAEAFHQQIEGFGAAPIIAHNKANPLSKEPDTDENGVPTCIAGIAMRRVGFNRRRGVTTYNCPAKRPTHRGGKSIIVWHECDCPLREQCEPGSKMGPLVHIRPSKNPRVNLPIPRGSAQFKALYKGRTGAERFFGVLKTRGHLGDCPYRRRWVFQMMVVVHAIAVHARAWVDHFFGAVTAAFDALSEGLVAVFGAREEVSAA